MYKYGMRLRGYSLGCQPMKGILNVKDDLSGKYYNILFYSRKLKDEEVRNYELDYLGKEEKDVRN